MTTTTYVDGQALASSVSRRLGKQHLVDRSATEGSRVSGFPIRYAGFVVSALTDEDGRVRCSVKYTPSSSDSNHRRAEAVERQAQRTVWLRSWLIEHGMDGWTIGEIETGRYGDLYFVVSAADRYAPATS